MAFAGGENSQRVELREVSLGFEVEQHQNPLDPFLSLATVKRPHSLVAHLSCNRKGKALQKQGQIGPKSHGMDPALKKGSVLGPGLPAAPRPVAAALLYLEWAVLPKPPLSSPQEQNHTVVPSVPPNQGGGKVLLSHTKQGVWQDCPFLPIRIAFPGSFHMASFVASFLSHLCLPPPFWFPLAILTLSLSPLLIPIQPSFPVLLLFFPLSLGPLLHPTLSEVAHFGERCKPVTQEVCGPNISWNHGVPEEEKKTPSPLHTRHPSQCVCSWRALAQTPLDLHVLLALSEQRGAAFCLVFQLLTTSIVELAILLNVSLTVPPRQRAKGGK
ncbi:Cyanate hydratase [Varanus komodoensis]|nr:Cyanate hydratase [Varanus komodoensis]